MKNVLKQDLIVFESLPFHQVTQLSFVVGVVLWPLLLRGRVCVCVYLGAALRWEGFLTEPPSALCTAPCVCVYNVPRATHF